MILIDSKSRRQVGSELTDKEVGWYVEDDLVEEMISIDGKLYSIAECGYCHCCNRHFPGENCSQDDIPDSTCDECAEEI